MHTNEPVSMKKAAASGGSPTMSKQPKQAASKQPAVPQQPMAPTPRASAEQPQFSESRPPWVDWLMQSIDARFLVIDERFKAIDHKIDAAIFAAENRMIRWIVGTAIGIVTLMLTVLYLRPPYVVVPSSPPAQADVAPIQVDIAPIVEAIAGVVEETIRAELRGEGAEQGTAAPMPDAEVPEADSAAQDPPPADTPSRP